MTVLILIFVVREGVMNNPDFLLSELFSVGVSQ